MPVIVAPPFEMSVEQAAALERIARSESFAVSEGTAGQGPVVCCWRCGQRGHCPGSGVSSNTVRAWRKRFSGDGVEGVGVVRPGRGRPPVIGDEVVEQIVSDTLRTRPSDGSTHWSTPTMAARHGVGKDTVARIWKARGLQPWRTKDVQADLTIPGLRRSWWMWWVCTWTRPSGRWFFVWTRSPRSQALEGSQRSLPLKPGRVGTMTH